MVALVVLEPALVWVFGVVGVVVVLAEVDVLDVASGVVVLPAVELLAACFDPPQPATASAAINAPETPES